MVAGGFPEVFVIGLYVNVVPVQEMIVHCDALVGILAFERTVEGHAETRLRSRRYEIIG